MFSSLVAAQESQDIIGKISPPPGVLNWIQKNPGQGKVLGLIPFLNSIIKLLITLGGIYAFFNIILAGYGFLSAGDDPKKVEAAWQKIYQSLLGLLFMSGSFVLAAIFGYILFGDPMAILVPQIYGP